MAALNALESQLREMMQCKICFEDRETQKQLPCQHTLCIECLNKLRVEHSKYRCPLCTTAYLVPNGGFETLPESLITKQLASLLSSSSSAAGQPSVADKQSGEEDKEGDGGDAIKPSTEASRKLRVLAQRANQALSLAEQEMTKWAEQEAEVNKTGELMVAKLQELKEAKIAEIEKSTQQKIDAVKQTTEKKQEVLSQRGEKMKAGVDTIRELKGELESRASELDKTGESEDVTQQLQKASESLTELQEVFITSESPALKEGDSVRLKMDPEQIELSYLDKNQTHAEAGYILDQINDKGRCAVLFPSNSRWVGDVSQLERSATRHNLPMVGDNVKVKDSVEKPCYEWGRVKPESVGVLREMKNKGPSHGRDVVVDFPEHQDWKGLFDDLEVVPSDPLKVGDSVWVKVSVTEPAGGWAGVSHTSHGTLLSVNGDDVVVNFSECAEWRGLLSELERVRPISVGDKVKVMKSVKNPKTGWAGVSHDDVGVVKSINDHKEYDKVASIDFPNRLGLWKCIISELELVERGTGRTSPSPSGGRSSSPDLAQITQRVTQQVAADQAERCAQQ